LANPKSVDELSSVQNGTSLVMGVGSLKPTLMTRPRDPLSCFRLISPPWLAKPDCPGSIKHHLSLPSTCSAWQNPKVALLNFQVFFCLPTITHPTSQLSTHKVISKTFPTTFTFRYLLKETKHSPFRGKQCSQWKHIKLSQKQSINTSSPWGMNICLGQPTCPQSNVPPLGNYLFLGATNLP